MFRNRNARTQKTKQRAQSAALCPCSSCVLGRSAEERARLCSKSAMRTVRPWERTGGLGSGPTIYSTTTASSATPTAGSSVPLRNSARQRSTSVYEVSLTFMASDVNVRPRRNYRHLWTLARVNKRLRKYPPKVLPRAREEQSSKSHVPCEGDTRRVGRTFG